jgi:hypothetical protein
MVKGNQFSLATLLVFVLWVAVALGCLRVAADPATPSIAFISVEIAGAAIGVACGCWCGASIQGAIVGSLFAWPGLISLAMMAERLGFTLGI